MKNTIKSQKNFDFSESETAVMPIMVVKYRPKRHKDAEYGIISNKRTFPTAVARNRARRLIRAWMNRTERPRKFDLLFIARRDILETGLTKGVGQMAKIFGKIKKAGRRRKNRTSFDIPEKHDTIKGK